MATIHDVFIAKLRALIDEKPHGSQGKIAEDLGMSVGAFSNIINGRNKDSSEEWRRKVCNLVGIDYEQILKEAESTTAPVIIKQKRGSYQISGKGGKMDITNNHQTAGLSAEEQTLINLLREKDPRQIFLRRTIADLIMRENPDDGTL